MGCTEFNKLIMMRVWEDLGTTEKEQLMQHLESCSHCREEMEKHSRAKELVSKMSRTEITDPEKEASVNHILAKINTEALSQVDARPAQRRIYTRTLRWIINVAAVFLIALFFYQQIGINRNIRRLNSKMEIQEFEKQQRVYHSFPTDFTGLTETQLESLLREYEKSLRDNRELLKYLQENHPHIYKKVVEMQKEKSRTTYEQ